MYLHTKKQSQYFEEVIRLHYERGYGERRISRILPVNASTVSRWIAIFASENETRSVPMSKPTSTSKAKSQSAPVDPRVQEVNVLRAEVARLQVQLTYEQLRADAYDEMIRVAESGFKISIRKKAVAKR